jgi:N-methylhydantoinase A/oxoprolinase/acetone carboxylase beta subunit
MVVKSDGSLMPIMAARERPIETLLSGPAASVAGAYFLTESEDALIVDMGGTTTDSALISGGAIRISEKGATVGKYQTHVRALDIRTTALGGDSLIALRQRGVRIGPLRVAPVSWLISIHPEGVRALEWIEKHLHLFFVSTRGMDLLTLTRQEPRVSLSEAESRIIELLRGRPYSLHELACRLGSTGWHLLPLRRLEANHLIQRCGLTPTDLLHVTGHLDLWNIEGAHKICDLFGRLSDMETRVFVNTVMEVIVRKLAVILLKGQVFEEIDHEELDGSPSELARVENVMAGGSEGYRVRVALHRPVIGVGAAVRPFLPRAAELLETESVIPPHADVANAIGAITGSVSVRKQVRISSDSTGCYKVCGFPGAPCFDSLESAHDFAEQELRRIVSGMARDAGTSERQVEIISEDRSFETIATGETLLERKLEASLSGKPDLFLLQPRKGTKPAN